ncbi:MAG: GDP-mannose 4,6-dehydratase, partial [Candidatus Pacebacteria bacterium CG10_big_fil_rev_8_21_14_0_10_42_12]
MKKAFITGITGQDGSYLAELLLDKGYKVYGLTRRTSTQNFARIAHIVHNENLELVSGDLIDQHSLTFALKQIQPDEIYNLAAQSFVQASWEQPVLTGEFTALGVVRVLDAMRLASPNSRFYQ